MTTYTFDDFVRDHADIIERMSPGSLASVASGVPFTRGGRTVRVGAPMTHREHVARAPAAPPPKPKPTTDADDWATFSRSLETPEDAAILDSLRRMGGA
ncbi:MAG: hypothetical protein IPG04_38050 [Polyangiaceae bacterium]|nr:hypothetical protein [Polyangiaceae bacterium]